MNISKEARLLLSYREEGFTLFEAAVVELVRPAPLYLVQVRETLDTDPGTLNRAVNRLIRFGVLEKTFEPAASGFRGAPMSALISLKQDAEEVA